MSKNKQEGVLLAKAIFLAAKAFRNKTDKGGAPYILHCLHVMNEVEDLSICARIAAVLHDLVEDTAWTLEMLRETGFSERTIELIDLLTFRKGDVYFDKIMVLAKDPEANRIKRADINHNSQMCRLKGVNEDDLERTIKYVKSYHYLENFKALN